MTTPMGPPPRTTDNSNTVEPPSSSSSSSSSSSLMAPPPPPPPSSEQANDAAAPELTTTTSSSAQVEEKAPKKTASSVPYSIPDWSGPPPHHYFLEVLKDGSITHRLDVNEKGAYMFGRVDLCDFVLEHPTISRFHAVLQFKRNGEAYLYDTGSTHGTVLNKKQIDQRVYVQLHVGDVIRFGQSSRLYIFQGPPELMPPETDKKLIRDYKMRQEMLDREASLQRARREASLADGISWGMGEDAIEEAEDEEDEVTWQTFKGQLTEKQEKTRDKIIKRTEKIAHMKKEIDAIRGKDIAQGGLTQGQQTQIARNEQRITQLLEELENLEETLNESICESIGARAGVSLGKKKQTTEDDEDLLSDDDDFYDRTKKLSVRKDGENQSVETADSLLDKRDAIVKEMEEKKELLLLEKDKMASETAGEADAGDALDAYMSGLSSQLVLDKTNKLEKETSALQSELDRIFFLLKIADPSGELAKRRDSKEKVEKAEVPSATKMLPPRKAKSSEPVKPKQDEKIVASRVATIESNNKQDTDGVVTDASGGETAIYTVAKPQWLGAVDKKEVKEIQSTEGPNIDELDKFVGYKERQKIKHDVHKEEDKKDSGIESAASGLIIRKRKETEKPDAGDNENHEQSTSSSGAEFVAEDAVALLLKHKRGYQAEDDEQYKDQEKISRSELSNDNKKPKRVLGPEKPTFLSSNADYESWVPPEGQSGDGRTALNDRYGY